MAAYTTLTLPEGYEAYSASGAEPIAIVPATGQTTAVLTSPFTLYLKTVVSNPFQTAADVRNLITKLEPGVSDFATGIPAQYDARGWTSVSYDNTSLSVYPRFSLYVPYARSLAADGVDVASLEANWNRPAGTEAASTSSLISSGQSMTPSSGTSPASVDITTTEGSSRTSNSITSPSNASSRHNSTPGQITSETSSSAATGRALNGSEALVSKKTFNGAGIGGTIGGIIAGVVACLLVVFCCFRRRRGSAGKSSVETGSPPNDQSYIPLHPVNNTNNKGAVATVRPLSDWQKHLPAERDDRAISNDWKTIFDQVQMHVEGYYGPGRDTVSSDQVAALTTLSDDQLPSKLAQGRNPLPVLEAIIVRWIVHRISLHGPADESLLPPQYSDMPTKYGWHMERHTRGGGSSGNDRKGFEPAFAEWRRLTGFLDPARGVDPESGELTARRIDQGVQKFAKAMVPWELPGKRASDRLNSLRGILQKASDAGILLFVQPSTFVFDWTVADPNGDELVLVSPALVEEPSEASDITRPRTLVEARFARI